MQAHNSQSTVINSRPLRRNSRRSRSRGVALIITLILLVLLSAASLAMFLLVSSDTLINGYYRSYRGSFYAADSGINVVVEAMKNAVQTSASNATNPPLPTNGVAIPATAETWVSIPGNTYPPALTAAYAAFQGGYYKIGDPGSWASKFKLLTVNPDGEPILGTPQVEVEPNPNDSHACWPMSLSNCTVNGSSVTNDNDYNWTFAYPYEITIQGQSNGTEQEEITEKGIITYYTIAGTNASGTDPSFAKWGAFITTYTACQGPLVPGTMTGPFFTDGQWNLGNFSNPGYTFTGTVGQSGTQVSYFSGNNNNTCTNSVNPPNGFNQPNFEQGLALGQPQVTPPSDSYNQAQAVLDAKGIPPCTASPCASDPPPSQTTMNQELKTVTGTAYPSSGSAPTGVYIPYYTSGTSPSGQTCSSGSPCYGSSTSIAGGDGYAGGFYVQGNASVTLTAGTGGDGTSNPTQTYSITQGATTTTIIVDNTSGTTTVSTGSGHSATTVTLQGTPAQLDPNSGAPITETDPSNSVVNPTLVYVNGEITGLSGTIQNDTGITVATGGSNDINITGDLTYTSQPVSVPSDTLNSTTNAGVLGIYTNGNIDLSPNSSGSNKGNLTVDASLAAIGGSSGDAGFATNSTINTWTIVGGRSEDHAHSVSINQGNTYYDQRFASGTFGPPWFPTAIPQPGNNSIPSQGGPTVLRTSWREIR